MDMLGRALRGLAVTQRYCWASRARRLERMGCCPPADPGSRLAYPVHETGTNEQTTIVDMACAEGQDAAVRIGAPASKHGVGDADILHAVRTAIRKIDMDDDLTMLIGPARDGAPLEIGVLDLNGEDPVVIHAMRLRPKFYPLIGQG